MKKIKLLIFVFLTFIAITNAQQSKIVGSWLITKAEVGNEVQNPYQITNFNEDGKFIVMGIEVGTWEYNKSKNAIVMKSEFDKDFTGEGKILNLTEKELIINKDGVKMYYAKVDMASVIISNKNSGLLGTWEFINVPYSEANTFVTFTEPDDYAILQKEEEMTSTFKGTWIFDDQEKSLIIIGFNGDNIFRGKNSIKVDQETIEIKNDGTVYKGNKKVEKAQTIEHLSFSEDDFYNEDGDYKYEEDEEKLPSWNWGEMKNNILDVNQLVYNYSILIENTESFNSKTLTANVHASLEEDGFEIDNIFNGYDSTESDLPINRNFSSPLYPLEENVFRVTGNEQITTPAGTFECTVIEVVNYSGVLKKLWMINDKIGIYAKIIEEDPDETFGHYYIYELQNISKSN